MKESTGSSGSGGTQLSGYLRRGTVTYTRRAIPAKFYAENLGQCVNCILKFQIFSGEHVPGRPGGLWLSPRVTASWSHCLPNHPGQWRIQAEAREARPTPQKKKKKKKKKNVDQSEWTTS